MYIYINPVDIRAFGLCSNSDGQQGVIQKRTTRRTRQTFCQGGWASRADTADPFVSEVSQDGTSTDGAVVAPTIARARQPGLPRIAKHVGSNAAAPDYSVRRLGGQRIGASAAARVDGIMVDRICRLLSQ